MNKIVKKAIEMDQFNNYNQLPELEIGDIVTLGEVWDGNGEIPESSYSYKLTDVDWINYEFDVIEEKDDELETVIKITDICLI